MDTPIRTVCCYCVGYGKAIAVIVDVPLDARGLSHGLCSACSALMDEHPQRPGVVQWQAALRDPRRI